jgi:Uma2 family endonuclease
MIEPLLAPTIEKPLDDDLEQLITEDEQPVDNLFSAKQQRLLVSPLYSSWEAGRPFLADSNVGIFSDTRQPPVVPDMFLSLDVETAADWHTQEHRSYFLWEFRKPPEVAVEIVSNKRGEEAGDKLGKYARLGVLYYVILDPWCLIQPGYLRVYRLHAGGYRLRPDSRLEQVGLSLTLWEGTFEGGHHHRWLRWCDLDGRLILTGDEQAEWEREQAEWEREQAVRARIRAEQEQERAEQADRRAQRDRHRAQQERKRAAQEQKRAAQADQRTKEADRRAQQERLRAEQANQRAEQERIRAEDADRRAERLAARLKALGLEPDD